MGTETKEEGRTPSLDSSQEWTGLTRQTEILVN